MDVDTKILAICDLYDGQLASSLAKNSLSNMGSNFLHILCASENYLETTRNIDDVILKNNILDSESLKGYLRMHSTHCSFLSPRPFSLKEIKSISKHFDFILISIGLKDKKFNNVLTKCPAIIHVDTLTADKIAELERSIGELSIEHNLAYPIGFISEESDANIIKMTSNLCSLPYLGNFLTEPNINEFLFKHAILLSCCIETENLGEYKDSQSIKIVSNKTVNIDEKIVTEMIELIRSDPKFKNIKSSFRSEGELTSLKNEVAIIARRLLNKGDTTCLGGLDREVVIKKIVDYSVGFGPIETLLSDPEISEIMVNRFDGIYAERNGKLEKTPLKFFDNDQLMSIIERMVAQAGRRIDESSPMVDARLPDGSRLNCIIPPLSINGPSLTIRRFIKKMRDIEDVISNGMLSRNAAEFLLACVKAKLSIIISGGTGSGKTTLLGLLASAIDANERIITIEDAAELKLLVPHVLRLEARPASIEGSGAVTIRDLVRNALRMRPDRIIIGECRGAETLDMLQAMNTGHEGSMTTVHANSPRDAISRLETMVLMSQVELPMVVIKEQIVRAIAIIVQVSRVNGGRRMVTEITELTGLEGNVTCMQNIAAFDTKSGLLKSSGLVPKALKKINEYGLNIPNLN